MPTADDFSGSGTTRTEGAGATSGIEPDGLAALEAVTRWCEQWSIPLRARIELAPLVERLVMEAETLGREQATERLKADSDV